MAKKYLDDAGVLYFWGKLKSYFQPKLVSGTNIKTINNSTLLGSGNISVVASETDPVFTASAAHGITSTDITNWNNKSDFSGSYTDLTNKPTIAVLYYGTCSTAAATVAKTVTVDDSFTLQTGAKVTVKFTHSNSASSPTLDVNSTGAKAIKRYSTIAAGASNTTSWYVGSTVQLTYDGSFWIIDNFNNTTYSSMSDSEYQAGTGTSARLITPATLKEAIQYYSGDSVSKTTFTPTSGSNYDNYGGCYYEKCGGVIHVHVGVSGLTANTDTTIYTLPSGYCPSSTVFAHGTGGAWNNLGYVDVRTSGEVHVRSQGTYCGVDITYMI